MAASARDKVESRIRMDGFASTLKDYVINLADMNRTLEEKRASKEKLQSILEVKCQRTAKLRAQVDAHRGQEQIWEKQEQTTLHWIKQLNKKLQTAMEQLGERRARGEELQQLRQKHVNQFEAEMHELSSEFRSLQLLKEGEDEGNKDTVKELSELEEEVMGLEDKHSALTCDLSTNSMFHLDTLIAILSEDTAFLEKMKERNKNMRDEEVALKQEVKCLQQETAGSTQQHETNTMQQ